MAPLLKLGDSAVVVTHLQVTAIRVLGLAPVAVTVARSTVVPLEVEPALAYPRVAAMARVTVLPKAVVTAPAMAAVLRVADMAPAMGVPRVVAMVPVMVGPRVAAMVPAMGVLRMGVTDQVTAAPRVAALARAMADRGITARMIGMTEIGHPAAVGSIP